jgi:hypothetical protein
MSDAGGAAFNPTVRTEDGPEPAAPADQLCADGQRDDQADDGQLNGEDDE